MTPTRNEALNEILIHHKLNIPPNQEHSTDIDECDYCKAKLNALIEAEVVKELEQLKQDNRYGFERLALVVEYQDGTNSGVIPYREHWNACYDKFELTINERIKARQLQEGKAEHE